MLSVDQDTLNKPPLAGSSLEFTEISPACSGERCYHELRFKSSKDLFDKFKDF